MPSSSSGSLAGRLADPLGEFVFFGDLPVVFVGDLLAGAVVGFLDGVLAMVNFLNCCLDACVDLDQYRQNIRVNFWNSAVDEYVDLDQYRQHSRKFLELCCR